MIIFLLFFGFIFLLFFGFIYSYFGFWYAKGMSEYIKNNYQKNKEDEAQECWKSFLIEFDELKEAIEMESVVDIILEGSDVLHALIKWTLVKLFPLYILNKVWIWLLVFLLVLPCTIKLGRRYLNNGCIRNHKNPNNLDHKC